MIMSQINIQKFRKWGETPQMRSVKKARKLLTSKKSYSWFKKAS